MSEKETVNEKLQFDIKKTKAIFGLGNLGSIYTNTRHNIGFDFLDFIVSSKNFQENKNLLSLYSEVTIQNQKIFLVKPTTMMNNSGEAIYRFIKYFQIQVDEMLIIHDDLDLQIGLFKIQFGKGPRSHNGINSIQNKFGTKNFWRIRIGIENRNSITKNTFKGSDYVLSKFNAIEKEIILNTFNLIKVELFSDLLHN